MNESKLKTDSPFASEITLSQSFQKQPSFYSEKSATIAPTPSNRVKNVILSLLAKYWFLLGLLIAILLAIFFPNVARKGGYIRAEWTIKWGNAYDVGFTGLC
jgi:sodium/bile acid cotransporter 7